MIIPRIDAAEPLALELADFAKSYNSFVAWVKVGEGGAWSGGPAAKGYSEAARNAKMK